MKRWDWADLVADALARVVYFIGTVLLLPACTLLFTTRVTRGLSFLFRPEYWVCVCASGILAALFGPGMYRRYKQRGLGKLEEIREQSRIGPPVEVPEAIPAEETRSNDDGDV